MSLLDDVKELMPPGLEGWSDSRIQILIDEGNSKAKILSQAWNIQATKTSTLVDVSESGSTRSISTIHKNAVEMAKYWADQAAKEDDNSADGNKSRSRTHKAVRV